MISFVLNSARKFVEGHKRNVPYSQKKVQLRATKLYYKALIRKRQGGRINEGALEKKRRMAKLEIEELNMEKLKTKYELAL